jgi:peroxiredoxin
MKQLPGLALLIVVLAAAVWLLRPQPEPLPGGLRLDFTDGSSQLLEQMHGRPMLVNFWSTDCQACVEELPRLAQLYREQRDQGVRLITVSAAGDPAPAVQAMVEQLALPFPVALDPQGQIARAFGVDETRPATLFVDRQGRIVRRMSGSLDMTRVRATLTTL